MDEALKKHEYNISSSELILALLSLVSTSDRMLLASWLAKLHSDLASSHLGINYKKIYQMREETISY